MAGSRAHAVGAARRGPQPVVVPGLTERDVWWLNGQLKATESPTIWFYKDDGDMWSRRHRMAFPPE